MATQASLLVRKVGATTWRDLTADGWYLTEMPLLNPLEVKEPPSNDWADQSGMDVYTGGTLRYKSFDVDIKLVCITDSPESSHMKVKGLLDLLTKNGLHNEIYSPWVGCGRTKVRFKKISSVLPHRNSAVQYVLQPTLTLTIDDPETDIQQN